MDDSAKTSRDTDALLEDALVAAAQEVVSVRAEAEARAAELTAALEVQKAAFERAEKQRSELEAALSAARAELESRPVQRPLEALLDELRPQLAAQEQAAHESAAQKARALELEAAEAKRALNDLRDAHSELSETHRVLLQQVESLEERFAETAAELRSERQRADALDEQRRSVELSAGEVQSALQEAQAAHALALQEAQDRAADELGAARDLSEKALAALRGEILGLQQALEETRKAGEQAHAESVAELEQQLEAARAQAERVRTELEEVQADLKSAQESLADRERRLQAATEAGDKADAQAQELAAARAAQAELEREKVALLEAHENLLADKDRLHQARLSDLEDQVEVAQRLSDEAQARAQRAEDALAGAEDRVRAELADELCEAEARAAAAEQALAQLKSTAAREVKVALESGQSREAELRKDLEASLQSLAELETALSQSQRQVTELESALARAEKGSAELQGLWESSAAELDRVAEGHAGHEARIEALQNELLSVEQSRTAERNALQAELDALIQTHDDVESAGAQERRRLTQHVEELQAELAAQAVQQRELEQLQAAYEALVIERDEERAAHERELSALAERSGTADSGAHARPAQPSDAGALTELQRELDWMREDRAARLEAEVESKALWQRERERVRELARELHEIRAENLSLRGRAATAPQTSEPPRTSLRSRGAADDTPASEVVPIPRADAPAQAADTSRKRSERKERNKDRRIHSGTSYAVNDIQEEVVFRPITQRPGGFRG